MCMSLLPSASAEVPGGDGPVPVPQTALLARGAPQANVRTFLPLAGSRMHARHQNVPRALSSAPCGEEGLRPSAGQTLDHSRPQQRGERTVWEDHRNDTAQRRGPVLDILLPGVERLVGRTLRLVAAIVDKNTVFIDRAQKKKKHISWHWIVLCMYMYISTHVRICIHICVCFDAVSFLNMKWHAQASFNVQILYRIAWFTVAVTL